MDSGKTKNRYTDAQRRATNKYRDTFSMTQIRTTKEQKEQIKLAAEKENKSINEFIIDCVFNYIDNN